MGRVGGRDQSKDRKALFLPKISAEISAERLSVLKLLSVCLQKGSLSAERPSFGRKALFQQKGHILVHKFQHILHPRAIHTGSGEH